MWPSKRPGIVIQRVLLHSMHLKIGACQEEFLAVNCSLVPDSSNIFAGQNWTRLPGLGRKWEFSGILLEFSGILLGILRDFAGNSVGRG